MIKWTLALLLIACQQLVFSQTQEIDSLLQKLSAARPDTNKVIVLRRLAATVDEYDPAKAIAYGREGIALGRELGYLKGVAGCYLNIGMIYVQLSKFDSAIVYCDSAILVSEEAGDPKRIALAYINRADLYTQIRQFEKAHLDCRNALEYARASDDPDRIGRVYMQSGVIYFYQEQYEKALEYYNTSLEYFGDVGYSGVAAAVMANIAEVFVSQGKYQEALKESERAIVLADSLQLLYYLTSFYGNHGEIYMHLKDHANAEKYYKLALELAVSTENISDIALNRNRLGLLYMDMRDPERAIPVLQSGFELTNRSHFALERQQLAQSLSEAYAATGKYDLAHKYLRISSDLRDSLHTSETNRDILLLQTEFDLADKERRIDLLNANDEIQRNRIRQQQLILYFASGLIILVIIVLLLTINRRRIKQELHELSLRNSIALDLHDDVGGSLSSIRMLADIAAAHQTPADLLQRISVNAAETIERMSDIIWMINPRYDDLESLVHRLERFMTDLKGADMRTSIEVAKGLSANMRMQERKELLLIVKEAIHNAIKYAGGGSLHVVFSARGKDLVVEVTDTGIGFDLQQTERGHGLDSMQARAKGIGAGLQVISSPGAGTKIILRIPDVAEIS
ncbi:MAG: tetratricopeptide repeat protein [Chitinophagales bacterium]|nr:tetratricopeptide repeat protein [Chitinophagales bacterium]HAE12993.1 hypothetical protein [Bacteroidota bacterium]MCB9020893.1 tetratricopeptide repeat protein [Chitinophagales bacterium]MCB9031900.1 tetratricopeptide repeat protein [Chitinophagales bacterium]HAE35180.1 hypothetical protein [Bacteroidota bacterium]